MKRQRYCDYCSEPLGEFNWNHRFDGPLSCGSRECNRAEREDMRAEQEELADKAAADGYERYR